MGKTAIGYPGCLTQKPNLPPDGKGWDEPWETYCFETECE